MHIKLNYFYFSAFDLEEKSIEILKYIQPFLGRKIVKDEVQIIKF